MHYSVLTSANLIEILCFVDKHADLCKLYKCIVLYLLNVPLSVTTLWGGVWKKAHNLTCRISLINILLVTLNWFPHCCDQRLNYFRAL